MARRHWNDPFEDTVLGLLCLEDGATAGSVLQAHQAVYPDRHAGSLSAQVYGRRSAWAKDDRTIAKICKIAADLKKIAEAEAMGSESFARELFRQSIELT